MPGPSSFLACEKKIHHELLTKGIVIYFLEGESRLGMAENYEFELKRLSIDRVGYFGECW